MNSNMKKIFFFLLGVLLASSVWAESPSVKKKLEGVWEAVGFIPYARLEFNSDGEGILIAIYSESNHSIFTLGKLTSHNDGFSVDLIEVGSVEKPEVFQGNFFGGQLHLKGEAEGDEGTWFTKSEKASMLNKIADEKLKAYLKKKP